MEFHYKCTKHIIYDVCKVTTTTGWTIIYCETIYYCISINIGIASYSSILERSRHSTL